MHYSYILCSISQSDQNCSGSISELFSKIAAFDKGVLVALVIGLLLGIVLIRSILTSIFSKKPPPTFRCARCRREVPHDNRTIAAWRSGKHKLFCPDCHRKWREVHPAIQEPKPSGKVGCLLPLTLIMSLFALGTYCLVSCA